VVVLTAYLFYRYRATTGDLYEPHFIGLRVGEVPIYSPDQRPVDVMNGLPISVSCEVVPVAPGHTAKFRLSGYKEPITTDNGTALVAFEGAPGTTYDLTLEYEVTDPAGEKSVVDTKRATVRLIPAARYLRVRSFETAKEEAIPTLTVPAEVIPYAEAALEIEGPPEDYSVLFFVQRLGEDMPVLQILVDEKAPEAFRANVAPLKKYREWGGNVGGFAAWPGGYEPGTTKRPPPIQIGNEEDVRVAFEVFSVLLRTSDVEAVLRSSIRFKDVEGGAPTFSLGDVDMAYLKTTAYKGWVSPPVVVVRADTMPKETTTEWKVE